MTRYTTRVSLFAVLVVGTGCESRTIAAGHAAPSTGAPPFYAAAPPPPRAKAADAGLEAPYRMVENDGPILAFAARVGRLSWMSGRAITPNGEFSPVDFTYTPHEVFLRTCSEANCAGTLRSWELSAGDAGSMFTPGELALSDSHAFWIQSSGPWGVAFCALDDCTRQGWLGTFSSPPSLALDAEKAIFNGTTSCQVDDCAHTTTRFDISVPPGTGAFVGGRSLVVEGDHIYLADDARVLRVSKSGTGPLEIIADSQANVRGVAVRGGYAYWTEWMDLGRLLRCPVTGCVGAPEVLASNLSHPDVFAVDDTNVYLTEVRLDDLAGSVTPPGALRISRIRTDGSGAPTVLVANDGVLGKPSLEGDFVYFLGQKCSGQPALPICQDYVGAVAK